MQSFVRIFSRNPLIRISDRIETAVAALAVLLVVIAGASAVVIGIMIHNSGIQNYLAQNRTRHLVVARAVDDSNPALSPIPTAATLHARWQFNGIDHADAVVWDHALKADEPLQIWVEVNCAEDNHHIKLGKESYFRSADGFLMPTRKDQPAPDLRNFSTQ